MANKDISASGDQPTGKPTVINGKVTKLFQNFGYVNDEIFFMKSCVKGAMVRIGDTVTVEALFQPCMPIKWNAEKVCLSDGPTEPTPKTNALIEDKQQKIDKVDESRNSRHRSIDRHKSSGKSPSRDHRKNSRDRAVARYREPRYHLKVPHHLFDMREASVNQLKTRYSNLYIPSDFFHCDMRWYDVFPIQQPMKLGYHADFHVAPRDVERLEPETSYEEPPDADYTYCAKVMLLASPTLEDLFKKTCRMAEEPQHSYGEKEPPTRFLKFLVGHKIGRSEPMAIGGPWSPSLDGENPDEDPQVLVNTAIRTCKAQTGIDLSKCTAWYRFLELHYIRSLKVKETRVETVVIFVPDVWSCMIEPEEFISIKEDYMKAYDQRLNPPPEEEEPEEEEDATKDVPTEPTHYKKLNPQTMKIAELRRELELRSLNSKGLKAALVSRLQEALDKEAVAEEGEGAKAAKVTEKQLPKLYEMSDSEKQRVHKEYGLCETPKIIVHPSIFYYEGKFSCKLASLRELTEYRSGSQREYAFEVSLFAEQFMEMLTRDCAFSIYKAIMVTPASSESAVSETKDASEPLPKRRKEDVHLPERKEGQVLMTADLNLLFSCTFFDLGHAEYIAERDLIAMFNSLNVYMSIAQIRQVLSKVTVNENFYYRKLTDIAIDEGSSKKVKVRPELDDVDYIIELSSGSKVLLEEEKKFPAITFVNKENEVTLKDKLAQSRKGHAECEQNFESVKEELVELREEFVRNKDEEARLNKEILDTREELRLIRREASDLRYLNNNFIRTMHTTLNKSTDTIKLIERQLEEEKKRLEKNENVTNGEEADKKANEEKMDTGNVKEHDEKDSDSKPKNGEWEVVESA